MAEHRFYWGVAWLMLATPVWAQHGHPTVIGATGRPYGPTQAEYQYQLQNGHPSPGSNGGGLQYVNGYPGGGGGGGHWGGGGNWGGGGGVYPIINFGWNPYGWYPPQGYVYYPSTASYNSYYNINYGVPGGYGNGYGFPGAGQMLSVPSPPLLTGTDLPPGSATYNVVPTPNAGGFPAVANQPPVIASSTPQAKENSMQFQTQGDLQLQQFNYLAAAERYRKAAESAQDRPEPRYRLAVSLAARSRFLEAVDQLKLAVAIDPTFPQHAESLDQLFGAANTFEKVRVKQRVAEWTLQDARDPNRLFLLGALMYLDGDPKSQTILQTAVELAGREQYLLSFMAPRSTPQVSPIAEVPQAQPPKPQPPGIMPAIPTPSPQPALPADQKSNQKPIPAIPPLPDELDAPEKPPAESQDPIPPPPTLDKVSGSVPVLQAP